jgi:hypothetical protein
MSAMRTTTLAVAGTMLVCAGGAGGPLFSSPATAAMVVQIDDFSESFPGAQPLTVNGVSGPPIEAKHEQAGLSSVLGGSRVSILNYVYRVPPTPTPQGSASLLIDEGQLSYSRSGSGETYFVEVIYAPPGPLDLTLAEAFVIDVAGVSGRFVVSVGLITPQGSSTPGVLLDTAGEVTIDTSRYNPSFVNLAAVEWIRLVIQHDTLLPASGGSITIDSFTIRMIPEPASAAMLAAAGTMLLMRRRDAR